MWKKLSLLLFFLNSSSLLAQYCTPSVTNNGLYFSGITFNYGGSGAGGIGSPVNSSTGNNGYSQYTSYSSGVVSPYQSYALWISLASGSAMTVNCVVYADWNNDGDFNDNLEKIIDYPITFTGASGIGFSTGFHVPVWAVAGNRRMRFVVTSGSASSCGSITGEVEDYLITVNANVAPVLNTSAATIINNITPSQTNNEGFSILEFVQSSSPSATLITDANDYSSQFSYQVPRGIAIIGETSPNGTWQFKTGTGSWTDFGAVSGSNALLLLADPSDNNYKSITRIRFVPTSTGSASFTYRAYDGTTGTTGTYTNIVSTGGTTSYSTATATGSITVVSPANYTNQSIYYAGPSKILKGEMDKSTGSLVIPNTWIDGLGAWGILDLELDLTSCKIFWVKDDYSTISYANTDGTGITNIMPTLSNNGIVSLTIGGSKIFYIDYMSGIVKMNLDGTGETSVSGNTGQLNPADIQDVGDIKYNGGNIYFSYKSLADNKFIIAKVDANGNNFTKICSGSYNIYALDISGGYIYFSDYDGTGLKSYLRKVAVTGGSTADIAILNGVSVNGICADSYSSVIYFSETDALNSIAAHVRSIPISGGTASLLMTSDSRISALAFNPSSAPLPVELVSFSAGIADERVTLFWQSATEVNNYGFDVERSISAKAEWQKIGFVQGHGNSNSNKTYSFTDSQPLFGKVYYRLKQLDNNGTFKYYDAISFDINVPKEYRLLQNSPNPFNPSTAIKFQLPKNTFVAIKIYDLIGREITTLINEERQAGSHIVYWNGKDSFGQNVSSGIYLYNLTAGSYSATRKMNLLK